MLCIVLGNLHALTEFLQQAYDLGIGTIIPSLYTWELRNNLPKIMKLTSGGTKIQT